MPVEGLVLITILDATVSWRKENSESLQRNVCTMRITVIKKTETPRAIFALVVLLVLLGDMTRYFLIGLSNTRACKAVSKIDELCEIGLVSTVN